jgi:hypothetical protein
VGRRATLDTHVQAATISGIADAVTSMDDRAGEVGLRPPPSMPADAKWRLDPVRSGDRFGHTSDSHDLAHEALVVVVLWTLAGSYVGGLVERVTGLGMTLPVLAAFMVVGIYLAVRIARVPRSATVTPILRSADQDECLAA